MNGVASIRCVRPILTTPANSFAFARLRPEPPYGGIRSLATRLAAAICIAVGNVSFDDCDMLTSSFGWIGFLLPRTPPANSIARFGDHLVGVHIRLRAAAGLPDTEGN